MALKIVLAYDISSDNTRARVAALVSSWGDRIQRSVYECLISKTELDDLLVRIDDLIDHRRDAVHVFPLCAGCTDGVRYVGQAVSPSDEPYWIL